MQGSEGMSGRPTQVWPRGEDNRVLCADRELHRAVGPGRAYGFTKKHRPTGPAINEAGCG